jgi:NAD(P)-dependent dehydrogenase (short-subunit alcohol dehydrogenase family)/predicted enzyme related to lactoylglutathione lyase
MLAARGYAVVVNYLHDRRAAESAVEAILDGNSEAVAIRAGVADDLDVARLFAETIAVFGGIDVMVHALSSPVTATSVAEFDLDVLDALVRINTRATFIVNREAARHLRSGGAIVNLTGSADSSSLPAYSLYAATKAATDVLTRALAVELRERDITVNAVSLEVERPCAPNRVADVVAYLLTDRGRRLTGRVLRAGDPHAPAAPWLPATAESLAWSQPARSPSWQDGAMERVIGIGGHFMRAADPAALGAWYRDCLGLDADENGLWRQEAGPTVFATFESGTEYFGSRAQQTMLNFRVRDLDAMLAQLRAQGADVAEETQDMEGVGRFGWVTDPEGNRVELWQPA